VLYPSITEEPREVCRDKLEPVFCGDKQGLQDLCDNLRCDGPSRNHISNGGHTAPLGSTDGGEFHGRGSRHRCRAGDVPLGVTARPLSPPLPLMTLATTRPPGRRRSESPEFPPVPTCRRPCIRGASAQVHRWSGNDAAGSAAPRTCSQSSITGNPTKAWPALDSAPGLPQKYWW